MSIEKSQYQSTVDLASPDEDANLLGQGIDNFSTKSWLKEHRKPLAIFALIFAVLGGYHLGSSAAYGASLSQVSKYGTIHVTVVGSATNVEGLEVTCYDEDCALLGADDFMGSGITNKSGVAQVKYETGTWDNPIRGRHPDIYCTVGTYKSQNINNFSGRNAYLYINMP